MIRINLLPDEYRRKARTPVKLLVAFSATVAVNGVLLAYLGWLGLAVAGAVDSERATLQLEMDGLAPQVKYHRTLESERKQYRSREDALGKITRTRVSWTQKLDELIDVINKGGDGQRHLVWLDDLIVDQNDDPRSKDFGGLRAGGHSGSEEFAQVANFLDDIEASPFIEDFNPPAPPEGQQAVKDEELVPPVVWAFPLSLSLKSPDEREKQ